MWTAPAFSQQDQSEVSSIDNIDVLDSYIRGINAFENGEYEEALDLLTAAYLKNPESPGVNFALADAYLALNDLVNAAYYGKIAVSEEPENKWYHLKLAEIYRKAGQNDATVEALQSALKYHPGELDILFRLATIYIDFGQLLEANKIYNRILKQRGPIFDIYLQKFRNFNALQMRDSALVQLQEMRKLEPDNMATLHMMSQFYEGLDERDAAKEILLEARERNARDPQTLILLADMYIKEAKWDSLANTFISMISDPLIGPNQKMELARYIYREHSQRPNESELEFQAERVLNSFSESEPDFGPAHLMAAEFHLQKNEIEPALDKLERATVVMPEQPDAWRQRMQLLFTEQRYEEVIANADSANKYVPDDAFIQFFAGASYMLSDQNEKAIEWLENATLSPARSNFRTVIYSTLADAYADQDMWEDAVDAYETALRLDANNHNAMNNYAYFMAIRDERIDYAEELALKAIGLEPDNAAYLDTVGWIFYLKNDYEKARQYIKASVETGEASAEVFEHLGDVYDKLGEPEKAKKWWQQAVENDPEREYLKERLNP
ncbi:MAG TPA: tetratricopeptide repeat protein [Balneolaceae bacterium]|nr:tetratricopeptide repeat protein [Balneolaceae bacterium]